MIVVRLIGGLGNQMFQYAVGRRLAHVHETELKLDCSWFATQDLRDYELGALNICEVFASDEEIARLATRTRSLLGTLLGRPRRPGPMSIVEKHYHFDPAVLDLPSGVHLQGYWQSPKYFEDVAPIIREELSLKGALSDANAALAQRMRAEPSVSVHVRRGDYVSDAHTNAVHGTCDAAYYQEAMQRILEVEPTVHAFVFSDDPAWVRAEMKLPCPITVVEGNSAAPAEDIRLMSLCRHHVIANSSFSWWGAWLGDNPAGRVVAPLQWFRDESKDTSTLTPDTWLRI